MTVGTTREPLEYALLQHEPQGLVLIASQGSLRTAAEVQEAYAGALGGKVRVFLLDNPEDLLEVYRKGIEALEQALEWESTAIIADITGGTKPMAAGLVLALSGRGVVFSYVGGERRDKGTGRVQSGSEALRLMEDPSLHLGLRDWEAFTRAWNGLNLLGALEALGALRRRPLTPSEVRFYEALKGVVEGLMAWDRFRHAEALERLKTHLPVALAVAEAWGHGAKVRVLGELEAQLSALEEIVRRQGQPTFLLLQDLLANAERRARQGRYDDALARLYRAIELAAEADLYERAGLSLRAPERWTERLPEALRERAQRPLGGMELLELAFDVGTALRLEATLAQRLWAEARKEPLRDLLRRRHESILAHGVRPVEAEDYQAFWDFLQGLDERLRPLPPWPRF